MTDTTLIQALISDFFSMLSLAVILLGVPFAGWILIRLDPGRKRKLRKREQDRRKTHRRYPEF